MKEMNIVIVGVGGQGTLLASRVLGSLAIGTGKDVKVSEVHGMSQRGGSVITYVRTGDEVASPMVDEGTADFVLAFEKLEALRALKYLKKDGTMLANTQEINPMPVITGDAAYPADALDTLRAKCPRLVAFDALSLAEAAGESRAVNTVLLGALSNLMDAPEEAWLKALEASVPAKILAVNLKAFQAGRGA